MQPFFGFWVHSHLTPGSHGLGDAHPIIHVASADAAGASAVVAAEDPDLEDLVVCAMAPVKRQRVFEQSSQVLANYASKCKEILVRDKQIAALKVKEDLATQQKSIASFLSSDATRALGVKLNRGYRSADPLIVGPVLCAHAFRQRKRSDLAMSKR